MNKEKPMRDMALFALGFGCLWYAGLAPMADVSLLAPWVSLGLRLVQGVVLAVLGISMVKGRGSSLWRLLPAACILLFCLVVFSMGGRTSGILSQFLDRLFFGTLFFYWLSVSLSSSRPLPDWAVPLGFFLGSLLSVGGFLAVPFFSVEWREGFEALSLAALVLYEWTGKKDIGVPASVERTSRFSPRMPLRSWILRYAVLLLGAVAFSFVFGTMTDLHGWMGKSHGALLVQVANAVAALAVAVIFAVFRKPFRPDAAIALVVPLFAAALLGLSAENNEDMLPRLIIMVGYLVYMMVGWVFILREQRALGVDGTLTLSLLCAAMLVFGQIGRTVAQAVLAQGDMSQPELSSLSLVLFWAMIIVAIGAYWLARTKAVDRDLALVEQERAALSGSGRALVGDHDGVGETVADGSDALVSKAELRGTDSEDETLVVVDRLSLQASALQSRIGLSARETEVVAEFARGRSAAVIAERLYVSPNTVKTHLRRIYEKAGIHSRQELLDLLEDAESSQRSSEES